MDAKAYDGYFENGRFIPFELVQIPERRKARVTIFEEVISDDVSKRLADFDNLVALIEASTNEQMPDFERINFARELNL